MEGGEEGKGERRGKKGVTKWRGQGKEKWRGEELPLENTYEREPLLLINSSSSRGGGGRVAGGGGQD